MLTGQIENVYQILAKIKNNNERYKMIKMHKKPFEGFYVFWTFSINLYQ